MLSFSTHSYSHKKHDLDKYDSKAKGNGIRYKLAHFSPSKKRILLGCIIIIALLYFFSGRKQVIIDVCAINDRQNINNVNFCSFDKESPDYDCTPVSPHRPPFHYVQDGPSLTPLVSVVIPFFEEHAFIQDVLESLDLQSLKRFEIIVVNDGSSSKATTAMEKVVTSRKDPRIRVVSHSKNRGLSAARNTGVSNAKTDYIFFIDSDDLIEPTTLEKCLWSLISYPEIGFTKGYTVGFGGDTYTWDKGFELAEQFLQENKVTATAMIRKSVFDKIGGYDESIRGGMEDWEFWLKCADSGIWGTTIPEYLDWYRRRPQNVEPIWNNFKSKDRTSFLNVLRERYKSIFKINGFPKIKHAGQINYDVMHKLPFVNPILKIKPRMLAIVPWFTMGGADRFNLNLIEQMIKRGWEVTLVATHAIDSTWTSHFQKLTPDVFILSNNVLRYTDYPRFLCYLIDSRSIDVILVTNSEAGYQLLPYIQSICPGPAVVDYSHMEEMDWKNGGYPRYAIAYSDYIDKHVVASRHLKEWLVQRDVIEDRIAVAYIGVDPEKFRSSPESRTEVRDRYGIPDDRVAILYAARMIPQKQPMVMVNCFKILSQRNVPFTALVAGTGHQRAQIDEFITRHNLGNHVIILGEVPPSEMPQLMSASDIVFLPSEIEGIASILYEAMAIENVIVGADVGGQMELVTPDVGYLQNISGYEGQGEKAVLTLAEMYAIQIEQIIENRDKVREMGKAGRERIKRMFTLEHMVETMENVFCEATKQKGKHTKLPLRAAVETAILAMQITNLEEHSYSLFTQNEQSKQKIDELRVRIGMCESECGDSKESVAKNKRCQLDLKSTHEQYMRCEQELANLYLEVDELHDKLNITEKE